MKIKPLIEKELIRNLNAREDFKEKLASLPEGSLRADIRGDKVYYSRRINVQHRLVYQVLEEEQAVKILSLWTHYEF